MTAARRDPDARGYFGEFGGRFVPETLVEPVEALERAYLAARDDQAFCAELDLKDIEDDRLQRGDYAIVAKRGEPATSDNRGWLPEAARLDERGSAHTAG